MRQGRDLVGEKIFLKGTVEKIARERSRAGTNWEQKVYPPVRKNNEASEMTGWA